MYIGRFFHVVSFAVHLLSAMVYSMMLPLKAKPMWMRNVHSDCFRIKVQIDHVTLWYVKMLNSTMQKRSEFYSTSIALNEQYQGNFKQNRINFFMIVVS